MKMEKGKTKECFILNLPSANDSINIVATPTTLTPHPLPTHTHSNKALFSPALHNLMNIL